MDYPKGMKIKHKKLGEGTVIKTLGAKTILALFPEQNNVRFYVMSKDVTVEEKTSGN